MSIRPLVAACLTVSLVSAGSLTPETPAVSKVLSLLQRLQTAQEQKGSGRGAPKVSFHLSESEINEYMKYSLEHTPRPGVQSATVKIFPNNYVSTYAIIDFDAVERWMPGTVPPLLRPVLNGKKSIWVDYRFGAQDGVARFKVERAYYQEIRLPAFFVEKMIEVVAARQPEKYDTSKPFPLPFGLRRAWTSGNTVYGEN